MVRRPAASLPPAPVEVTVALEPVYNILTSMSALWQPEKSSGLDDWVIRTAAQLPPAVRQRHAVLFGAFWLDSLTNLVAHGAATADFPAYLAAIAAQDPVTVRDKLLDGLLASPNMRVFLDTPLLPVPTRSALLADVTVYIRYLEQLTGKQWPAGLLAEAYQLLNEPVQLQTSLVDHLEQLWATVLAPEWARIQPILQESVDAFQAVDFGGLSVLDAMQVVTGRNLRSLFRVEALLDYQRIRFIPHLHSGPYIVLFGNRYELCLTFAARRPHRQASAFSALDQAELVNRLRALADETRIQILAALRQTGELSTQEIIDRFQLNKSAASRHLRQLFANNLITERREEGAKKVYGLNSHTITETAQLLAGLAGQEADSQ
jgi:DNA-binding transcriptional ArsR family regulator